MWVKNDVIKIEMNGQGGMILRIYTSFTLGHRCFNNSIVKFLVMMNMSWIFRSNSDLRSGQVGQLRKESPRLWIQIFPLLSHFNFTFHNLPLSQCSLITFFFLISFSLLFSFSSLCFSYLSTLISFSSIFLISFSNHSFSPIFSLKFLF